MSHVSLRLALVAVTGLGLAACSRGNQTSEVNPLPRTGFSETLTVGKRGTQAFGPYDTRTQGQAVPAAHPPH